MVSNVDYLLSLRGSRNDIIRDTWVLQGAMIASKRTRKYIKDNIFQVSCSADTPLNGSLIYCLTDYYVNDAWPNIDWDNYSVEDIEGIIGSYQGVESPFFKVLLNKQEVDDLDDVLVNEDLDIQEDDGGVLIDDEQLGIILTEVGIPFLRIDELELTKSAIKRYCIKPAFDTYFGFFPIIKEEEVGALSGGTTFKKEFPKNAYAAVPYYVLGGGSAGSQFRGAFSLYREQMMYGGGAMMGGAFGRGVSYRKPVPGYVGLQNADASMNVLAAQQGYINYFRREHVSTIKENGKRYAVGFSTVGGTVNIKWLCNSYDFDDIKFSIRTDFRKLCKAHVLRNLGMLRALVKVDVPGTIDFSMYTSRADTLENEIREKWEKQATSLSLSVMRGGL